MKQPILCAAFALIFTVSANPFSHAGERTNTLNKQIDSQSETVGDINSQTKFKMQSSKGKSNDAQNTQSQSLKKKNTRTKKLMKKW